MEEDKKIDIHDPVKVKQIIDICDKLFLGRDPSVSREDFLKEKKQQIKDTFMDFFVDKSDLNKGKGARKIAIFYNMQGVEINFLYCF